MSITYGYGQISPGDLSQAHANLEGMTSCTQCHDLGNKVTDQKCLECHTDIQSLINNKSGYHANPTVIKQDCVECHSEHHGRNFDMVRFDQDNFDHNLTGYELEGKHATVDCKKCHVSENISDKEIKKRPKTFMGLDEKCLSCHDDYHQKTLSSTCFECHDMKGFKPAPKFDHDKADFQLKGEHAMVDCIECHKETIKNGKEFHEFTGMAFDDCVACHKDPHNGQLAGTCVQCHKETAFSDFVGKGNFDHKTTEFTLKGRHNEIDCFSCHKTTDDPLAVFQNRDNVNENSCVSCHKDVHEGKFGTDCVKCHRETSFKSLRAMDFFDHTKTDYPLEGKHIEVDCKQCHKKSYTTPIDFTACTNCHKDYHQGEFKENGVSPDCVTCHSLENGFDYSLYTLEEHQKTDFPLEGAHNATPCYACHVGEKDKRWTFRNMGSKCVDCHQDIHEGYMSAIYYPNQQCTNCHNNGAWSQIKFNHDITDWPLTGKHNEVDCKACHFNEITDKKALTGQKFANLDKDCVACHENVHGDEFAVNGVTNCIECHVTTSWFPATFDHSLTDFPLEGKHAEVACSACHEVTNANGDTEVIYKIQKFRCIDCHLQ